MSLSYAILMAVLPPYTSHVDLVYAIGVVESGWDLDAVGDGGKAIGPLQIHRAAVEDVNGNHHTSWTHAGCRHPLQAASIFESYMSIYARPERLGRPVTDEDRARIWNGGPNGWRKDSTRGYWAKVKVELERPR
jgi:hypothetical protein